MWYDILKLLLPSAPKGFVKMNILHLKYAIEVEKYHSINKAAEMLFMSQPNLSRAMKELEEDLGITIFKRTSKGMTPTIQGEEFLSYAKKILAQIDEVENMYKHGKNQKQKFSVSVPRATYFSEAFAQFSKSIDPAVPAEIFYKETNSLRAINNILQADYNLGIIRYRTTFDNYFGSMLNEKGLSSEVLAQFSYVLLMSKNHVLADKKDIRLTDLSDFIEIAHADPYVPSLPFIDIKKEELGEYVDKRIFVFERASQFDLLENVPNTFMWVSPLSKKTLDRYGLIQKNVKHNTKIYQDVLIHRKSYHLSELDKRFIDEVSKARQNCERV